MWWTKKSKINFAILTPIDDNGVTTMTAVPLDRAENVTIKPSVGDVIYFDNKLPQYIVDSIYHSIHGEQRIWVYLNLIKDK